MLKDGKLADVASDVQAGMIPHGPDEYVVAQPDHVMKIIAGESEKVFTEKGACEETSNDILNEYCLIEKWGWPLSSPPTFVNFVFCLSQLGYYEPGTDGAPPPPALKFCGEAVAKYIEGIVGNVLSGITFPPSPGRPLCLGS